ncbi:hypothetical protein OBBRIDRAFT_241422 [Obba rivulosa]|uniref:Uncharacterized protein n=1 Tax=Obba rivulosa TaxID=1052685 RepID=A0A8E2DI17_9APHY|nr:hypothetical protein OBBRIDRAFT_241422 [Obba rivulosa]
MFTLCKLVLVLFGITIEFYYKLHWFCRLRVIIILLFEPLLHIRWKISHEGTGHCERRI